MKEIMKEMKAKKISKKLLTRDAKRGIMKVNKKQGGFNNEFS